MTIFKITVSKQTRSQFRPRNRQRGFTLMEVMISIVVLTIGLVSMLAMFSVAMAATNSAQEDLIAKQETAEALESIFTGRNTSQIKWSDLQNKANGGIFLDGIQPLQDPGPDGLVGTADDLNANPSCGGPSSCLVLPGHDGLLGTADDVFLPMNNYTRQIQILNVANPDGTLNPSLRQITITVNYTTSALRATQKSYSIGAYISSFR
jgi:prepilin-type N-terminal cleavage/methylation domain-containing protein